MERIVTLRFVSKESGLSVMELGTARKWGFVAEHKLALDNKFNNIILDGEKIDGVKVTRYKKLGFGIKEVTFKVKEDFDFINNFLEEFIYSALKKVANKNFKAAIVADKINLNYGFGLRAKVIKYRVSYTSKNNFIDAIKDYFKGITAKQMQEVLEKAEKIYEQKVKKAQKLKTLAHIKRTKESYKKAIAEIREKARKKFGKKSKAA